MAAGGPSVLEGRRRGWSQFTLRTLALAMLLTCVGAAFLGVRLKLVAERERAIAQLLNDGFTIFFAGDQNVLGAAAPQQPASTAWFRLRRVDSVCFVNPWETTIVSGETVRPLAAYAKGADDGLAERAVGAISKLPEIRELDLACVAIQDHHLARLSALRGLERLDLSTTRVTDAGLSALADLPRLESLHLESTAVTHNGISALAPLPKLSRLWLPRSNVHFDSVREALETFASEGVFCYCGRMTAYKGRLPPLGSP